jgi:RIP metalloprotease RseP
MAAGTETVERPPSAAAPSSSTAKGARALGGDLVAWTGGGAGSGEPRTWPRALAFFVVVAVGAYFVGPYVLLIIAALLVSIVLHEAGHYWTAKASGMKVTEFFVGFGPRLVSFRRGETTYGVKALPLGAYVRIIGMNNLEEVDPADEARTYRSKGTFKRMAVVLAGPFMNGLIAVVLLFAAFSLHGSSNGTFTVGTVQSGTAAAQVGLQQGDTLVSVNGDPVTTFDHFHDQLDALAGHQVTLVVDRGGQQLTLTPTLGWRLGDTAAAALPSSPALEKGDLVHAADGNPVATYDDLKALLAQPGAPVTLDIQRASDSYTLVVNRPLELPAAGASGFLGVQANPVYTRETPIGALAETGRTMGAVVVGTAQGFGHLLTPSGLSTYAGQVVDSTKSASEGSGQAGVLTPVEGSQAATSTSAQSVRPVSIVGIVEIGSDAAESGVWVFLSLVALVNLALMLINLLPILPFDGGHAAIAAYEGVRGRIAGRPYRADLTKMMPVVYGVITLLLILGTTSILLDVLRPPSLGP